MDLRHARADGRRAPAARAAVPSVPGRRRPPTRRRCTCAACCRGCSTQPEQPCPWCGADQDRRRARSVRSPRVPRRAGTAATTPGCPICHRRIAIGDPFVAAGARRDRRARQHARRRSCACIHLGVRHRRRRARSGSSACSRARRRCRPEDRDRGRDGDRRDRPEGGDLAAAARSRSRRRWRSRSRGCGWCRPDRAAMVRATQAPPAHRDRRAARRGRADGRRSRRSSSRCGFARSVAGCGAPCSRRSSGCPPSTLVEDMRRHRGLWKRVGERLHPFELAQQAAERRARVRGAPRDRPRDARRSATSCARGPHASPIVRIEDDRVNVDRVGRHRSRMRCAPAMRASALARLDAAARRAACAAPITSCASRRRASPMRSTTCYARSSCAIGAAARRRCCSTLARPRRAARAPVAAPRVLSRRARCCARGARRIARAPLRGDAIAVDRRAVRSQLVARAEARPRSSRARSIDRGLVDLLVPISERTASRAKLAWPRGSEIALPDGADVPAVPALGGAAGARASISISRSRCSTPSWRHVGTCDYTNLVVAAGRRARRGPLRRSDVGARRRSAHPSSSISTSSRSPLRARATP